MQVVIDDSFGDSENCLSEEELAIRSSIKYVEIHNRITGELKVYDGDNRFEVLESYISRLIDSDEFSLEIYSEEDHMKLFIGLFED